MPASLAVLEQRLENKRAALNERCEQRDELFSANDDLITKIEALEEEEDLDEAEQKTLEELRVQLTDSRKSVSESGDKIRRLEGDISNLESERIQREENNRMLSANSAPVRQSAPDAPVAVAPEPARPRQEMSQEEAEKDIVHFIRCQYIADSNKASLLSVLAGDHDHQYDRTLQYKHDRLHAAVQTTNNPSLIPQNYQTNLIEFLRPAPIVRNLAGVRQIPLPNGNLRMPRQTGSSTANYVGEMVNIPLSEPTTDQLTWTAKKLTVMVVESGEIMRHSNPSSDQLIRDDIQDAYREKEDETFLRAAQTATIPGGLKHFADQTPGTQVIAANAANTLATIKNDLGKLKLALRQRNVPIRNRHFIMGPRAEQFLLDIIDGNGNPGFPEMERGMLRQVPYSVTTLIPENLGGGGNESEVYLIEASELVIADTDTFKFNMSEEAAYHDGTNVQAAYSQDAVAFRLIVEHDTNMRHLESIAYLNAVTWGA